MSIFSLNSKLKIFYKKVDLIDRKLTRQENSTNENNENVLEVDLLFIKLFLFQIVLELTKNVFY